MTLSDLEKRLSEAEGPDRELDAAIAVATTPATGERELRVYYRLPNVYDRCEAGTYWRVSISGKSLRTAPEYTASLDAAVALVERALPTYSRTIYFEAWQGENLRCAADVFGPDLGKTRGLSRHKTEPLALCLALIRALQLREGEDG